MAAVPYTIIPNSIMDDIAKRIQEEQELRFKQELFRVPQFKVNTEDFNIDYFRQPWITYDNYIKPNCIVKIEKENNKMEAKKCDKCGKLYETESASDSINVLFKQEKVSDSDRERYSESHNNEMRTHEVIIKKAGFGETVDLCLKCREAFKKWFEEG